MLQPEMIHSTAIIHPKAKLDPSVQVGPYAVIDENVSLGADCVVGPYVYLTGVMSIGAQNVFHAGCVIGDAPQDLKYRDQPTRVRIGDGNVFREHATVHRATTEEGETVIGSQNFLMAHSHVAHNCILGDHVILANGALLAGHVSVGDRAFISGNCVVHQSVRIGTLALMRGGSAISQDLPPYCVANVVNELAGLNIIGLRRAGLTPAERMELKRLYRLLFRSRTNLQAALAAAKTEFTNAPSKHFIDFVASAKRGVCRPLIQGAEEAEVE